MKKTAAILLSWFYLLLYAGIPVTVHYCNGNAEKIRYFSAEDLNCCCEHSCCFSKNCCRNEHHLIKADIKEQLNGQRIQIAVYDSDFPASDICLLKKNESEHKSVSIPFSGHAPPGNIPVWLLNCTLIYYS